MTQKRTTVPYTKTQKETELSKPLKAWTGPRQPTFPILTAPPKWHEMHYAVDYQENKEQVGPRPKWYPIYRLQEVSAHHGSRFQTFRQNGECAVISPPDGSGCFDWDKIATQKWRR